MTTTKTTTIAISSASTFSSTTAAEAAPVSRGCGPVNSTDLALGLANERREKLSEADKREQMRIALSIETGTGESGRGDRIVSRGLGERWPNGVVPYILSCSYDEKDRGVIATAIDNIEKTSCVRFRGATVEDKDYVTINNTETDVGKGISINMESFNFDGDCSTNYVEVRIGRTQEGALIEKYCTGSVSSTPKKIKSTALWIGWKRTSDNTIFSLIWTTFTVSCCSKLLFENHSFRNGFYEKNGTSIATGPLYKDADDDEILYYGRIEVDSINNLGWKVGPSVGLVGVSNLDPVTCPEDAQSPWRSYNGSEHVYIADSSVRCSDCSLYPTFGECLTCCNEVILSSTDAGFLADSVNILAGKYILYTTTPTLNGRKVYQLESNTNYCLYFTIESRWNINTCAKLGETGFFITSTTTSQWNNCVHAGLPWQWRFNEDTTMKVECISTCTSDPPATPSTATSTWDSSTKTVGTVVTYTCPDTTATRTVCDADTLAWIPATIPDC